MKILNNIYSLYSDKRKSKAKKIDRAVPRQIHAVYANSGGTFFKQKGGGHNKKFESCLLEMFRSIKGSFLRLEYFCMTPSV